MSSDTTENEYVSEVDEVCDQIPELGEYDIIMLDKFLKSLNSKSERKWFLVT